MFFKLSLMITILHVFYFEFIPKIFLLSAEYFPFNNQYRCNDTEVYKYIT